MFNFDEHIAGREATILLGNLINKSPDVFDILTHSKCYIAGGAITSVFTGNKINDYDIYFPSFSPVKDLEIEPFHTDLDFTRKKLNQLARPIVETDFALSYEIDGIHIQLISLYAGMHIEKILSKFDFTCCMGAFCPTQYNLEKCKDPIFILNDRFLMHNSQRRLVYNVNSQYPFASIIRMKKYMSRGYDISGLEMLKLVLKCNSVNIQNYADLRENMLGIDTLVFKELTDTMLKDTDLAVKEYDFQEAIEFIDNYLVTHGYYDTFAF